MTKMVLPDKAVEATGNQRYVALDVVVRIRKTLVDGKMNFAQVAYSMGAFLKLLCKRYAARIGQHLINKREAVAGAFFKMCRGLVVETMPEYFGMESVVHDEAQQRVCAFDNNGRDEAIHHAMGADGFCMIYDL